MLTRKTLTNHLFVAAVATVLINIAPQIRAQVCGGTSMVGSTLQYVVRDAKGAAIDAAQKDLQVAKSDSPRDWAISGKDFIGNYKGEWNIKAPDKITNLVGKVGVFKITSSPQCNFRDPVKLQISLAGKTMNLVFLTPKMNEYQSAEFLVDSIPFQEGTFAIDLPIENDGVPQFYPAAGWKKAAEAGAETPKDGEAYFEEGMKYFGAKKYREAIESLTKATKAKPDYAEAFTPLGIAYIQLEMYEEAIAPLREAIRLDPNRGLSHGALGQAYLNLGLNKDAAAEFKEAARLEPAREMWRDGLNGAMDALDAPPYDFIKQEAEKLWRLDNPGYLKDAANVAFKYRSIGVKRQPKGVLRPAGIGSAGNSIDPLYSSDIKLTASVTYSKPREYVVDYQEEDHLCFYKKTGETTWSAALCERATKDFVKVDPKVLDDYVGQYQMPATESHQAFILTVSREGDKLMSEAFGHRAEFMPYSETEFYMREERVELRFVRDAQGKVAHIDWGGVVVKRIK